MERDEINDFCEQLVQHLNLEAQDAQNQGDRNAGLILGRVANAISRVAERRVLAAAEAAEQQEV
jgi:hypothetical protein